MIDPLLTIVGLGTALVSALIYSIWRRRKEGRLSQTNYRAFFMMGLVWFMVGSALIAASIILGMPVLYAMPLFALGAIYLAIALLNKGKWRT